MFMHQHPSYHTTQSYRFWNLGFVSGCDLRKLRVPIPLIWPPPCNSDHQDYYMFSRGFLLTFTFHCYREGAISNQYLLFAGLNMLQKNHSDGRNLSSV